MHYQDDKSHFHSLTPEQQQRWRERVEALGLDPDRDTGGPGRIKVTRDVAEYTRWFGVEPLSETRASVLDSPGGGAPRRAVLRTALIDHITGAAPITDEAKLKQLEEGLDTFYAVVDAAPDIEVTAANPLIINTAYSITDYGVVTLKDGGYIEISVPASFKCERLVKLAGGGGATADFIITGVTGSAGEAGADQPTAGPGNNGSGGQCDSCGGIVKSDGTNGTNGHAGLPGGDGRNAGNGANAPDVNIDIGELQGRLVVLNTGGAGGDGGRGGNGGTGGNGGNGGSDVKCGATYGDGGNGGNGGDGGNGGNGATGGNGGNGGFVTVKYRPAGDSSVNKQDVGGSGGRAGDPGAGGHGGSGGASGGRGASPGGPGTNGKPGVPGQPGQSGQPGTTTVEQR
jgi:hypothetical protein